MGSFHERRTTAVALIATRFIWHNGNFFDEPTDHVTNYGMTRFMIGMRENLSYSKWLCFFLAHIFAFLHEERLLPRRSRTGKCLLIKHSCISLGNQAEG